MLAAAAGALRAAPTTGPSPEAKVVADLFGQRIAAAMASEPQKDNLELAREMLLAAAESGNPPAVRYLLALEVVKVTASLGSAEGAKMATEALAFADQIGRVDPVRKAELAGEIARTRFRAACKSKASGKVRQQWARKIVAADLDLANILLDRHQADRPETVLKGIDGLMTVYHLSRTRWQATLERCRWVRQREASIRAAEAMLALARDRGDAKGEKEARCKLGMVYLSMDGDVAAAAKQFAGTGHPDAEAVAAGAAFLKDPKSLPPPEKADGVISRLCAAADGARGEQARERIGGVALEMCRAFLQSGPAPLAGMKVRLLVPRAEKLAGQSPADLLIRQIQANCGPLLGRFEALSNGRVRVSYDFSDTAQFRDWTAVEGAWRVLASKHILAAAPDSWRYCRIDHRLAWRADRPFKLSLRASGRKQMEVQMMLLPGNLRRRLSPHRIRLSMGAWGDGRSWEVWDNRTRVYQNTKLRVVPGAVYRVVFSWDGRKTVSCTVNGKVLKEFQASYEPDRLSWSSVLVELSARGDAAGFDNVVMEGLPLPDPTQEIPEPGSSR